MKDQVTLRWWCHVCTREARLYLPIAEVPEGRCWLECPGCKTQYAIDVEGVQARMHDTGYVRRAGEEPRNPMREALDLDTRRERDLMDEGRLIRDRYNGDERVYADGSREAL